MAISAFNHIFQLGNLSSPKPPKCSLVTVETTHKPTAETFWLFNKIPHFSHDQRFPCQELCCKGEMDLSLSCAATLSYQQWLASLVRKHPNTIPKVQRSQLPFHGEINLCLSGQLWVQDPEFVSPLADSLQLSPAFAEHPYACSAAAPMCQSRTRPLVCTSAGERY